MPIFSDLSLYYCGSSSSLPPSYYSNQYSALNPSLPSYTSRSGGFSGFSSGLPFSNPPPRLLPTPPRITKYSPLLPTISESTSISALSRRPLPRISSPRGAPIYRPPKPIDIDTADIDVTTPRKRIDRISRDRDDPQQGTIKRGRTVVRLHTRRLKENPGLVQNRRKTPGEKLVEKFLIKDRASEEAKRIKLEEEASRLKDVYKETALPEAGAQAQAEVVENGEICNHRRKSIQDCLIELEGLIDFYEPEQTFHPGKEEKVGEERQYGREDITSEVLDRLLPEKVNEPVEASTKLDEVQVQEPEHLPNVENSISKQASVKEKQKKSAEKSSTVKKRPKKRDKKSTVKKVDKKVFEKKETPIEKSLLQRRNTVKKLRRNSRDVEQLTLDLNSGTLTCDGTTIPTSPVSSTPDTSIASTPTSSVSSTPVGSIPTTPADWTPSTPADSKISTPVTSLSSTPKSSKQSTPIGSTLSTPVASSPTTPINSRPSTPTSPFAIKTEPTSLIEKRKPVVPKSQSSDRDIFPFKTKNNEVNAEPKFSKKICVDVSVENAEDLLKKSPLKFVVDEIKVEEIPKSPKSPKLFRCEVIVEEVAERQPFQKQKSVTQTCEALSNQSDAFNTLKNIVEENEADVEFWNTEDAEVHKIYKRIKNISKFNERERDIKDDTKDCNFTPESTENTFHVTKKQSHDQPKPLKHTENKLTKENTVQNLKLPNTKQIPSKKQIQTNRKVQEINVKQKEIRSISNLITMEKKVNEMNLQKDSESEILKDKMKLKILNGILAMETPKFPVFTQFIPKTEDVKVGKDLDDNILATYSTWGERLNDSSMQTRKTIEVPKYTMEPDDKVTSLKNIDVTFSKNITESSNIPTKKKTEPLTTLPKLAGKSSSYDQQKKEDAAKKNILLVPKKEKVTNDNVSLTEPVIKNQMLGVLQTMESIEKVEEKSKVHSTLNIETLKEAEKISITTQNEAISVVAKKDEQDIPAWKKALIAKAQANKKSQEPPDHQQKSEQVKQNLKSPTAPSTDILPSASCTPTESSSASQSEIVLPIKPSPDSPLKLKQNPVPETIKTLPDKPKLLSSMEINQTVPETSTSEDKRQKQDLFLAGKTSKDVDKTISEKLTTENADEICSKGSSSDLKSVQNISNNTSTDKSKTDGRNAKLSEKSVEIMDIKLFDNKTDKSSTLGKQRQFENNTVGNKQNNFEVKEETKDIQPKLCDGKLKPSDKPPVVKKKVFEDKLLESKPKSTEIKSKEKTKPAEMKVVNTQLFSSEKQPVEKVMTKEATDLTGKRSSMGKSKPADLKLVNIKTKSPEISPTEKSKSSVAKVTGNSEKTNTVGKENHPDLKSADNKTNVSEISPTDKIKSTEKRSLGRKPKPTGQISVDKSTFNETKPEVKSTPSETSPTEIAVTTDKGTSHPRETSVEKGKVKVKVAESKPSKSELETSLNKTTVTDKLDPHKCESSKEKSIPKLTAEKTSTTGKEVVQIKSDVQDKTRKFGRGILGQEKPSETVAVLKPKAEATPITEEISVSSSGSTTADPKTDETQKDEVQQVSTTDEKDASSSEEETESEEETDTDDDGASTSSSSSTDTATSSTALLSSNPALGLDPYEDPSPPSTLLRGGRVTPPATTIPRFRKYVVEDFQFLKVLGKGSFGKVLLAELKGTECYYAVKCLKKDVVLEDDDVECTLIERKVLALGTKHPYLCHLFCTFQTESHLFFVMEYLNGGDLMFHIQQSGRFQEPRARFYAAEIVSGLKFLHKKGVVYRDLKLDNILLDFDGHVRIADFGMCKLQIYLDRTADTFCGTPDYMAPEIIKGLKYNQCVDWWSFGILLYEMLIGQSPFSGCDEDDLFWSICNEQPHFPRFLSREASSILSLLLEKDSSKRLGTTECMAGDVTNQPFFRNVDWDALERRELEPPFKPRVQHPLDVQYFDKAFTVERAKLTPVEREILQSMDQTQFQGFSYTNPNATD